MRKYLKHSTIVLLYLLSVQFVNAQHQGPFFRQFNFNPYLYNPAFAGINNQAEMNVAYRKQWLNFKDAPSTAAVNFQLPASPRVALGFSMMTDKQVLMKTSSFAASFVYIVPLAARQTLRFGLSGGVGMNSLNLGAEELNTNDPVIMRATGNNFYSTGNFGVIYTNNGLKLGFAFTDLLKSNPFSPEKFNKFRMDNLRNRMYSVSYRFNTNGPSNISVEPYFLYKQSSDGLQNYWEAATMVHFGDNIWTGAGYNQNKALAVFLGLKVMDKFQFGYSFEFPPGASGSINAGSHELQLKLLFGQKMQPASRVSGMYKKYTHYKQRSNTHNYYKPAPKPQARKFESQKKTVHPEKQIKTPLADSVNVALKKNITADTTSAGQRQYYVIAGAFQSSVRAIDYAKNLLQKGQYTKVIHSQKNNLYYVAISSSDDADEARKIRDQYRTKPGFKNVWLYSKE